ncbi:MAG TPA: response regulator transcription factor [Acidimicrobiales bacterium]|nr:response regulator transcription factor [Acidimicrobiales bacterium]
MSDARLRPGEPIRVLVADDHALFRRGLTIVLEAEGDIEVVAEAADGEAAVTKVGELAPDVVLMDIRMPHVDGLEATRRIRQAFPMTRIIVLTVSDEEDDLLDAIKSGANGYLLKEVSIEEVADAVRAVMAGHSLLSPAMATKLISEFGSATAPPEPAEPGSANRLTDQELQVLRRVARGLTNDQIANELGISESGVRNHVANILGKLQFRSRVEAALVARQDDPGDQLVEN